MSDLTLTEKTKNLLISAQNFLQSKLKDDCIQIKPEEKVFFNNKISMNSIVEGSINHKEITEKIDTLSKKEKIPPNVLIDYALFLTYSGVHNSLNNKDSKVLKVNNEKHNQTEESILNKSKFLEAKTVAEAHPFLTKLKELKIKESNDFIVDKMNDAEQKYANKSNFIEKIAKASTSPNLDLDSPKQNLPKI